MGDTVKEEPKNKKIHNYLLLLLLFAACVVLVLYICKIYTVNKEEQLKVPIIRGYISEIYSDDLEHYVLDNPTTVLYICVSNSDSCRSFERGFKKFLTRQDYSNQIVYLNLTDVDQNQFVQDFNQKYHYKIKLTTDYPAFVLFEDGEVKSILQGDEKKALTITKLKHFLELNEIGE
jgi:predicted bacteriocin transport accessory protein